MEVEGGMPQKPDAAGANDAVHSDARPGGNFREFYERRMKLVWIALIASPWVVLATYASVDPGTVYGLFWAPIVADAVPGSGESTNYNAVNTAFFGATVLLVVIGLYELRRTSFVEAFHFDFPLLFALTPLMLLGGVLRALQDTGLFTAPSTYAFIAPLIYLLLGLLGIPLILLARWIGKSAGGWRRATIRYIGGSILILTTYSTLRVMDAFNGDPSTRQLLFFPPPYIAAGALFVIGLPLFAIAARKWKQRAGEISMFCYTLSLLMLFLFITAHFGIAQAWWQNYLLFQPGATSGIKHPWEALIIPGITAGATALFAGVAYALFRWRPALGFLARPENVLLVCAQFLDGVASARGIDLYGYGEKNVLPSLAVGLFGTGLGILVFKLLIVLPLIYLLDRVLEEDLRGREELALALKAALIVVALGPGTRDLVRIVLGT